MQGATERGELVVEFPGTDSEGPLSGGVHLPAWLHPGEVRSGLGLRGSREREGPWAREPGAGGAAPGVANSIVTHLLRLTAAAKPSPDLLPSAFSANNGAERGRRPAACNPCLCARAAPGLCLIPGSQIPLGLWDLTQVVLNQKHDV